jgi:hypothetical protein
MKTSNDQVKRTAVDPDLSIQLRVQCVECNAAALHVPLPIEKDALAYKADEYRWHLSVLTEPGSKTGLVLGLLCPACAERVYPPEVLKAAEEARERRRLS